jgi:hypothetical protein
MGERREERRKKKKEESIKKRRNREGVSELTVGGREDGGGTVTDIKR